MTLYHQSKKRVLYHTLITKFATILVSAADQIYFKIIIKTWIFFKPIQIIIVKLKADSSVFLPAVDLGCTILHLSPFGWAFCVRSTPMALRVYHSGGTRNNGRTWPPPPFFIKSWIRLCPYWSLLTYLFDDLEAVWAGGLRWVCVCVWGGGHALNWLQNSLNWYSPDVGVIHKYWYFIHLVVSQLRRKINKAFRSRPLSFMLYHNGVP